MEGGHALLLRSTLSFLSTAMLTIIRSNSVFHFFSSRVLRDIGLLSPLTCAAGACAHWMGRPAYIFEVPDGGDFHFDRLLFMNCLATALENFYEKTMKAFLISIRSRLGLATLKLDFFFVSGLLHTYISGVSNTHLETCIGSFHQGLHLSLWRATTLIADRGTSRCNTGVVTQAAKTFATQCRRRTRTLTRCRPGFISDSFDRVRLHSRLSVCEVVFDPKSYIQDTFLFEISSFQVISVESEFGSTRLTLFRRRVRRAP